MINRRTIVALLPAIGFAALALLFLKGLSGDPSTLPSVLIGKPAPAFTLPAVEGMSTPGLAQADLTRGKVTVVNIFASWCGPCRDEHPILMELSKNPDFTLVGINNKDQPEDARRFLSTLGNPFAAIGADRDGRVAIDWGGYGVPETFIVDGQGIIRHKIIGPITPDIMVQTLLPEVSKAKTPLPKN